MHAKQGVLIGVVALATVLVSITLGTSRSADAARPFGDHSLDGAYHFSVVEIREGSPAGAPTVYCNSFGVIEFDGAGGATIDDASGYGFCSNGDLPVQDDLFSYEVFANGEVILTELGTGNDYVTHCRVLNKGELLLCDGTGGGPGASMPAGQLLWTATAGKL